MKVVKTKDELIKWMWKTYPDVANDSKKDLENYLRRSAMLEAYHFLIGVFDEHEKKRKEIADSIYKKLTEEGM
jgi:hypothetical protein